MWTENKRFETPFSTLGRQGIAARHRVSIPDFERFLGGEEVSKDKPLQTYLTVANNDQLAQRVQLLMADLFEAPQYEPLPDGELANTDYLSWLNTIVQSWAADNGVSDEVKFKGS